MLPLANRAQTSSICGHSAWSQCAETIQISSGVKRRGRFACTQESVSDAFGIWRTAHFEASRPVRVRLSVPVRVTCPKAAPIAIEMVKRRTHECVPMQTRCRLAV